MSDDEVPSTTEELYKYMQENTKGGHYGFVEQHSTAYYAAGWLHAFGGYILNENGEPGLDDENTIKALEYHKKFVELMSPIMQLQDTMILRLRREMLSAIRLPIMSCLVTRTKSFSM